ncbi:sulfite exporter TauE/SafE family protein [Propionibacterium freudenreichii]|uniref:sulfite exporter TauE/SafE family protein n=1 Tax=Propionibacterium freudenreichii TaxID=1744 RepID=UPI0006DD1A16|nr:sulfite exporter TauE/SafE family protein [Propionibacterium freudenreichii]
MELAAVIAVAVIVGIDKSLLPGAGTLAIGILANVIPARQAWGLSLALIIVADWCAIWAYRKDVDWGVLRRLLPNVVVGIGVGAIFLALADDTATGRTIGVILLVFIIWNLLAMARKRRRAALGGGLAGYGVSSAATAGAVPAEPPTVSSPGDPGAAASAGGGGAAGGGEAQPSGFVSALSGGTSPAGWWARARARFSWRGFGFGGLAGFTTMVANAGGPVTTMYFLAEGLSVTAFLGTTAWFFLVVNLIKLPISLSLGMLQTSSLPLVAAMVPVILATVLFGRWLARRINPSFFRTVVVALTFVAAIALVIS